MGLADEAIKSRGPIEAPRWQAPVHPAEEFTFALESATYPDVIKQHIKRIMNARRVYENSVAFVLFGVHL